MTKEESLKLFRYFSAQFAKVHARFDDVDARFDDVYVILDGMKGELETVTVEYAAMAKQTTRHEKWIKKAAKRLQLLYHPQL